MVLNVLRVALCCVMCGVLDELEAFLFLMWQARLEENGVGSVLGVEQRIVSPNARKATDAVVPLGKVAVRLTQRLGTAGTSKCPSRCHLYRRLLNNII